MAGRYPKFKLDYFPMPVDFECDDRILLLRKSQGWKGEIIATKLISFIFGTSGYYVEWNDSNQSKFLSKFSFYAWLTGGLLNEIVAGCVRHGVFDKCLFDTFNILTSSDIQHTWLIATRKRTIRYVVRDYFISSARTPEEMEFMAEEMRQRKGNKIYFINKDGISSSDLIAQYESGTDSAVRSSSGGEKPVEGGENGKQNSPGEILINYRQYQQSKRFEGQVFTSIVKSASIRFHHASHSEIEEMLAIFINRQIIIKSKDDTAENITMHFINWLEKQKPTKNEPTAPKKGVNPNKSTGYKTGTYSNGSDIKSDI